MTTEIISKKEYYRKHNIGIDVDTAARRRINIAFDNFEKICVSFSAGKDSGVLLNLVLEEARKRGRTPIDVLIVDLEAQYQHTVDHAMRMLSQPDLKVHWICLPISLRNSMSMYQPKWICWDLDKRDVWVRDYPDHEGVINDPDYFPFFEHGMEFETFVPKFAEWLSDGVPLISLVGIRADESINRLRTIKNTDKETFEGYQWTTRNTDTVYSGYPIYDWKSRDIWIANSKYNWDHNSIYDLMHQAGVPYGNMRLCQPYGDDQRQGLYLFKLLEPETWNKVVSRVEGANFGGRHANASGNISGNIKISLPDGHTWKSFVKYLLKTLPPPMEKHYRERIHSHMYWWLRNRKGTGVTEIVDFADPKLEAMRAVPSWRRFAKVILRNDYWAKGIGYTQGSKVLERYRSYVDEYRASRSSQRDMTEEEMWQ